MNVLSILQHWGQWFNQGWHNLVPPYLVTTGAFIVGLMIRRAAWIRYLTAPIAGFA